MNRELHYWKVSFHLPKHPLSPLFLLMRFFPRKNGRFYSFSCYSPFSKHLTNPPYKKKKGAAGDISSLVSFKSGLEPISSGWLTILSSLSSSCYDQARSKRSRFITLFHTATKSCRNFSRESSHA